MAMASAGRYTGPFIDPHTHCRDGPQQAHKATIRSVTDHAPHTEEEKMRPKNGEHASGISSLNNYEAALDLLRQEGITEERIEELGYCNVKALFPKIRE